MSMISQSYIHKLTEYAYHVPMHLTARDGMRGKGDTSSSQLLLLFDTLFEIYMFEN